MASFHNRPGTLLLGAVFFTLVLTGGCLSGGGGGGSSGGGSTVGLAPSVTEVDPQTNSAGAVITAIVLALFDQDMEAASINSNTFTLTGPSGDVPGDVGCDNPCRTASFDPIDPLDDDEDYTATLDDSIRDADGDRLLSDFSWTFSTAPEMVRASTDAKGFGGNQASQNTATDKSGRFVAFDSTAVNLVIGDSGTASDVFVKDTQNGQIERVSVNAAGIEGDDNSTNPAISADGRFVAFESAASNLLSSATPVAGVQVYVKDRETGRVTLVSADGSGNPGIGNNTDGNSTAPSISADGRYVAFQSNATNLVTLPPITAGIHVYVKDLKNLETGDIKLASADNSGVAGDANSTRPAISADGEFVAFQSASPSFGADGEPQTQIFRKDLITDDLLLVSATDDDTRGNGISANPSISDDGQFVAFETDADNLGADNFIQIVRKDTQASLDSLVVASADDLTGALGDNDSLAPSISDDGRYVAFQSRANLVGFTSIWIQLYVKDLQTGASGPIAVVSRNTSELPAGLGEGNSVGAAITRDGGYVGFDSAAENLTIDDSNGVTDAFRGLNSTFSP